MEFKCISKIFKKNNVNWDIIHDKICDLIIKTIISVYQELIDKLERDNLNDRSFFNILGFDILITKNYEPILLEVNHAPSVNIYDKLDIILKRNLLVDTFNRVGITPFSKEMFDNINKENNLNDNVDESINNAFCEFSRPIGDYELIFPLKENIDKYKKFFGNINEENEKFWKIIKE